MTISTLTSTITYQGNGATTAFTFPFVAVAATDLVITLIQGGSSQILNPSQYSVALNAVPVGALWAIGGSVTYPLVGSPLTAGNYIAITRAVPFTQSISINNQGAFYPQAVEQALDLLELQIQQLETSQSYSLQLPVSDVNVPPILPAAAARANLYLAFDANGNPIVTAGPGGGGGGGGTITAATPRSVTVTGTNTINMLTSDAFGGIVIYQSSTPITTVQLPTSGGPYPVFDGNGNASTSPITVLPPGGKQILGQTSFIINQSYAGAEFFIDGAQVLVD